MEKEEQRMGMAQHEMVAEHEMAYYYYSLNK
jgi:hypothetical protein